ANHCESLSEGERKKQFSFLSCESEDRNEGENNDRHRKENRPADELGGVEYRFPHLAPVLWIDFALFEKTESILRHHDAGIDEHADGDCDARERHQIRADSHYLHEKE